MKFVTQSGSVYELDQPNKRICRHNREYGTSQYVGRDADWRPYELLVSDPKVGQMLMIIWGWNTAKQRVETTITSPVVKILEESNE